MKKKINLYETNINECNKIINDLKERNGKINNKNEENFELNKNNNESTEEELQLLKNQNAIYLNNLKSKENTIELMSKENEKLINENKIYRNQIEQYTQQITNLYNTIKQKNKLINIFKIKEGIIDNCNDNEFEKKLEGMKISLSQENMHLLNNTFSNNINNKDLLFDLSKDDLINSNTFNISNKKNINQSIDKLINDNEENKIKIEILNNKIKSLDQFEKKYYEFMKINNNNNLIEDNNIKINKLNDNNIRYTFSNNDSDNKKENDINTYELSIKKEKIKNEEEKNMELNNEENKELKLYKKYIKKEIDKIEEKKESEEVSREEDTNKQNKDKEKDKEKEEEKEKENMEIIDKDKNEKEKNNKLEKERREREEKERKEKEERERREKEEEERREREEKERREKEEKERREREERERIEKEEKERREREERERIEREEKERREREEKERREREERERKEKEEKERIEREERERKEKEERERIEREEKERIEREERERREKEEKEKKEKETENNNKRSYFRRRRFFREQREEEEKKKEEEKEEKKDENKKDEENSENNKKSHGLEKKDEKEEIKETVREMNRKKNYTHIPKNKKRFKISDELDVTEINTSSPVVPQNLSFSEKDINEHIYLFGIDRNDNFHIFDLKNKKWSKKKILEIEDISDTFQKDYQYEGTILYNTLNGVFILTGKKLDVLYYYNSQNETINKICKFNNNHDNGSLMLDKESNRLFVFGGKNTCSCEYYSFNDKKINSLPDLNIDRANASFIICNNKIYGFFGYSYNKNNYAGNIEYINSKKLDKWYELKDINILNKDITFDIESASTLHFKENLDKILIYAGIKGENEDFITEHYYLYDTKENNIDLIQKWSNKIMKYTRTSWRNYKLSKRDPQGFHFAKNSNFLELPKGIKIDGYDDEIELLIDYKNNVHFINQDKKMIDIFKGDI